MGNYGKFHNEEEMLDELKLILVLLAKDDSMDIMLDLQELIKGTDWDRFIKLARHHRVFPLLHRRLQELKTEVIPTFVTHMFNRDYYRNTLQMLGLSGEMEQLAKAFSDNGIRSLFLKGPVIAADLYGDVSLRTSYDLDLLITFQQLEQAEKLLLTLGYEKNDYTVSSLNDWKWRQYHTTFLHPGKGIKVELYWRLIPVPSKEPSFNELWERKRKSSLINRPIYYLSREDLFLFLVSHGSRRGWSRLRWLLDIKQIANQSIDWVKLARLLKKHMCLHTGGQALLLAARLLSFPLREEMKPLLSDRKAYWLAEDAMFYVYRSVNLHTSPISDEVNEYHKRYLFSLLTTCQKIVFIASFIYNWRDKKLES
ncbi:nucleotidyltransferase domain-containing protein [Paenibacillus sp. sgz302251]|uniref:nucleotidyltransferase domain-containing protein n=1 Tax=Paenibacillus sp. sgz302251 TaxID=3414493 RepID=UPI003C7B9E33